MAKGLLVVAFAACLFVSGHAVLPLEEILGGVTGAVTGLTGTLTDVLNGTVPQLTKIVEDLVKTLVEVVRQVLELVLKLLQAVVDALQEALNAPLQAVLGVVDSLTKGLLPSSLADALKSALKLDAVTALVKQLTGTVTCLLDKVVANLTSEVLKGVVEILKCANPLVKEVGNVTKAVEVLVKDTLDVAKTILEDIFKCVSTVSGKDVLLKLFDYIFKPLGKGIQELSKIIAKTTPKIQQALDVAVKALQCIQNVIIDKLNKVGTILKSVADCASGQNVPKLSGNLTNFSEIANNALNTINNFSSAAVGSSSALNTLFIELNKLKVAAEAASTANAEAAVMDIVRNVQAKIKELEASGVTASCITQATEDLKLLAIQGVTLIEINVASIAPDATTLISQAAKLKFELKKEAFEAAPKALQACAQYASATDNSAQLCFDMQVQDAKDRNASKVADVNKAIEFAKALTAKTEAAVKSGIDLVDKGGHDILENVLSCEE